MFPGGVVSFLRWHPYIVDCFLSHLNVIFAESTDHFFRFGWDSEALHGNTSAGLFGICQSTKTAPVEMPRRASHAIFSSILSKFDWMMSFRTS